MMTQSYTALEEMRVLEFLADMGYICAPGQAPKQVVESLEERGLITTESHYGNEGHLTKAGELVLQRYKEATR